MVRERLLDLVKWFLPRAASLDGIEEIAMFGQLCTEDPAPGGIDLLVSILPESDIKLLAALGRKISGRAIQFNKGASVFLVERGSYIGKTCYFREPHPRVGCGNLVCVQARPFLCHTGHAYVLSPEVVAQPTLILWPEISENGPIPDDVRRALLQDRP